MYSKTLACVPARVAHAASCTSSTFTVAKKLSATMLSQQLPRPAHAADDPVDPQGPPIVGAGILVGCPIRVMEEPCEGRRRPRGMVSACGVRCRVIRGSHS